MNIFMNLGITVLFSLFMGTGYTWAQKTEVKALITNNSVPIPPESHIDTSSTALKSSQDTIPVLAIKNTLPFALNDTVFNLIPDDPILDVMDSLIQLHYRLSKTKHLAIDTNTTLEEPLIDSIISKRLDTLNAHSPFDLMYRPRVKPYIDLYIRRRKEYMGIMLSRSDLFFPMFEEKLDQYGLPDELKYLAIVESALNPKVRSRVGATGLWQFMVRTGKAYGLTVNSYVDERCDPLKATEAACKHLSYLYKLFKDWDLALAAYNSGEGTVSKAIRRAGGKRDYWSIRSYLPRETRGYVPAFIAVNYAMKYGYLHGIQAQESKYSSLEIDTVHIKQNIDLLTVSKILKIDLEQLKYLNPRYKTNIVPALHKNNYLYLQNQVLYLFFQQKVFSKKEEIGSIWTQR